jgi:hypothetical protein
MDGEPSPSGHAEGRLGALLEGGPEEAYLKGGRWGHFSASVV